MENLENPTILSDDNNENLDCRHSSIIGPLNFDNLQTAQQQLIIDQHSWHPNKKTIVPCLFCKEETKTYEFPDGKDLYLAHLFMEHKFVIADVDKVPIIEDYLIFWHKKLQELPDVNIPKEYCTTLILHQYPDGKVTTEDIEYFLLSDDLPLDYEKRVELHNQRLNAMVQRFQYERNDQEYKQECLYCRYVAQPNRRNLIDHLYEKHYFKLGNPQKIVFIDDLIEVIRGKLDALTCIYCEKIYKDRATLKEHMRKKRHKQINPNYRFYDNFYTIRYKPHYKRPPICDYDLQRQMQKKYVTQMVLRNNSGGVAAANQTHYDKLDGDDGLIEEPSTMFISSDEDNDSAWSGWEPQTELITCLFCKYKIETITKFKTHIRTEHEFDIDIKLLQFTFYQKVKIINYIRRQMYTMDCVVCQKKFTNHSELTEHLKSEKHYGIGEKQYWDQPEFFFPTYEDDPVLIHLEELGVPERSYSETDENIIILPNTNNTDDDACANNDSVAGKINKMKNNKILANQHWPVLGNSKVFDDGTDGDGESFDENVVISEPILANVNLYVEELANELQLLGNTKKIK